MMLERRLDQLATIRIPAVLAGIVLISTITHHLSTPFPASVPLTTFLMYDFLVIVLIAPLLYHCIRVMGKTQGLLFFFTVSIFVGSLEALWVFLGKLGILGDAYDYPIGGLWFFGIPLYIALGWFIWVYVFYFLVRQVFPKAGSFTKACLCGLLALSIDIWMDPATVNASLVSGSFNIWNWTETEAPRILTVPVYNFIGWFLTVATVVYLYETAWARIGELDRKGKPFLRIISRLVSGWIIFVAATKSIQLGLDRLLPGLNLLTLGFETKGELGAVKIILLSIPPVLIISCLAAATLRAVRSRESRKDIWFVLGFIAPLLVNLQTAYSLQLAFPDSYLIYFVVFPILLPFGLLLRYLVRRPEAIPSAGS